MKDIVANVSFYEQMTILVPGVLVLSPLLLFGIINFGENGFESTSNAFLLLAVSYSVGILIKCLVEAIFDSRIFKNDEIISKHSNGKFQTWQDYVKAYYRVYDCPFMGSVKALEIQLSFMKNMFLAIIFAFIIYLMLTFGDNAMGFILSMICLLGSLFTAHFIILHNFFTIETISIVLLCSFRMLFEGGVIKELVIMVIVLCFIYLASIHLHKRILGLIAEFSDNSAEWKNDNVQKGAQRIIEIKPVNGNLNINANNNIIF